MRLSFKQYMEEAKNVGTGDCFEVAGRLLLALDGSMNFDGKVLEDVQKATGASDPKDFYLVHALVRGQGALTGKRFGHGWVEWKRSLVIDYSNGNEYILPRSLYYNAGQVEVESGAYVRYDIKAARRKIFQAGHWGPWDLDESLEEKFDVISKKKVKVSREVLKALA